MADNKLLIAGLGNPGKEYDKTRHNAGYMLIDKIINNYKFPKLETEEKFSSQITTGILLSDIKLILAKPLTFMNNSGDAIQRISKYYKIPSQHIYVAHDDLDIDLGEYKIQYTKGPRQHNGINSIERYLGSSAFNKIRIGIENRGDLRHKITGKDYVLSKFTKEEQNTLQNSIFESLLEDLQNKILDTFRQIEK